MQPFRAAFNLAGTVVSTALGLAGRARDLVLGRGDDDVWNAEKAPMTTTTTKPTGSSSSATTTTQARAATAKPKPAATAKPKPAATAKPKPTAAAKPTAEKTKRANGSKVASAVALKDRPSLAERLETVTGIGPAKRDAILAVYDDVDELAATDVSTLAEIDGISLRLAKQILAEIR